MLRAHALSLPEATEVVTWEVHNTYRVRNKIFVVMGEDGTTASIKATPDEQRSLLADPSAAFAVAPHTGRFGWVLVTLAKADAGQVKELVTDGWRLTAPKRLVRVFDEQK